MEARFLKGRVDILVVGDGVEDFTPEVVVRVKFDDDSFEVIEHVPKHEERAAHFYRLQREGNWNGPKLAALAATLLRAAEVGQQTLDKHRETWPVAPLEVPSDVEHLQGRISALRANSNVSGSYARFGVSPFEGLDTDA